MQDEDTNLSTTLAREGVVLLFRDGVGKGSHGGLHVDGRRLERGRLRAKVIGGDKKQ